MPALTPGLFRSRERGATRRALAARGRAAAALLAALALCPGCRCADFHPSRHRAPPPVVPLPPPVAEGGRTVLRSIGGSSGLRFELAVRDCELGVCLTSVDLIVGGELIDQAKLDWSLPSRQTSDERVGPRWGAGDPLLGEPHAVAVASGPEARHVSTLLRPIQLSLQVQGVLVDQRAGFEELKRSHQLFVVKDRKLVPIWSERDGEGPDMTSTMILPAAEGHEQLVVFRALRELDEREPDQLEAEAFAWDSETAQLVKARPALPVLRIVLGSFPSIASARARAGELGDCLEAFSVVPRASLEPGRSGFVLVAMSLDLLAAEEALEAAKSCSDLAGTIRAR